MHRWLAGVLTVLLLSAAGRSEAASTAFPKDQVITVAVTMAEADLEHLLANATDEKEYPASVTWDGRSFTEVAFRAKGNSSLSSVARSDSKRFSFKLDLDRYVDGQLLEGIGTMNLNNNFSDPSFLREYLSYEAFASMGLPTPKIAWVQLSLNGKPWGLYLAVEQVGAPFLARHFATGTGDLYKPASQQGKGADLKWYGNSMENYTGVVYKTKDKTTDHKPLLAMLDALNNGGDLEKHLNVDAILRYFATSTVLSNFDSYQGSMLHNYYLYEQGGRFSIIPWDLNMSFAGFNMGGTIDQMIGVKIDEPTMGPLADRPLIAKLLAVPEYLERYHGYIRQLADGYLNPDRFEARARAVQAVIAPFVKADPTKFYTYDEFRQGLDKEVPAGQTGQQPGQPGQRQGPGGPGFGGSQIGLVTFVKQRVANVRQQLDGKLPSKGDGSGMGVRGGPGAGGPGGRAQGGASRGQPPNGMQPPPPMRSSQAIPLALSGALLLGAILLVWRLKPRI